MEAEDETRTSSSLLLRLKDLANDKAWEEFLVRYGPKIFGWCRRYGLQEADASDITQEVLRKLLRAMQTFEYNASRGRFRAWLKTVTNNAIRDFVSDLATPDRGTGGTTMQRNLSAIQDREALQDLAATIEAEGEQELLLKAEQRVRQRVQPHTWQAYFLTVHEALKAPEAAEQLQLDVADVYIAKSRVIKLLRQEVDKLDESPQLINGE